MAWEITPDRGKGKKTHSAMEISCVKECDCWDFFFSFLFFSCRTQFSSNSCNCCLIIWHIHISKCIQLQPVWDAADWVREFIHYNEEQSAPLSFSDISLFMMLSMALRLSENSGKQCVALRYIESSTIRSCVVDHLETGRGGRGGARETNSRQKRLSRLFVRQRCQERIMSDDGFEDNGGRD